jgi:hypothetical protein
MKWAFMKQVRCYSAALFACVCSLFSTTLLANDALPDMAFLEYLAELVEVDGELIGPQDLSNKTNKSFIKEMNKTKKLKAENKKENTEENKLNNLNDHKQEDK